MINKQILILLISSIFSLSVFGQISQGGVPPSFLYLNRLRSASDITSIPVNLDISRLTWEDDIVERNDGPARVAEVLPVDIDITRTGNWTTFSDSVKIWQQTIYAERAKGLILSYKDFYIPEGAKLFIYNADHTQILGAYTKSTHPEGGAFATEIIWGEKVTLEYVVSEISNESPRLTINDVGYIYNNKTMLRYTPVINQSDQCMINVNCPAGDNWKKQKRGVVLYLVQMGARWYGCSGSLVNNTRRDGTPYILTANHCFVGNGDPKYDSIVAYFNYEFPRCQNDVITPVTTKTLTGTDLMVSIPITTIDIYDVKTKGSDGALLKLKQNIPNEWMPFYNGWDRRNYRASSGVVIHHPYFDVKKISTFPNPASTSTFVDGASYMGVENGFWSVQYDGNSITQRGSSGSPLFSQEGLIVGTFTGGSTDCNIRFGFEYYGKFGYHWDYFKEANKQLKPYLDPINEGTMTLKGYDPNYPTGVEPEIEKNTPKEIVVFPTLADNEVNINTNSIIRSITVYDLAGRQVYTKSGYNASTTTIPVDGWQKGVYSVVIQTDNSKLTDRFMKK